MLSILDTRKRAIAYYRHSAEDKQENSVGIQRAHAQKFAVEHRIEILHEEADEGKSGLSADRPAFNRLFDEWILNPNAPEFEYVLVYDVSRWGRFQDQDQAGYLEFLCRKHGKTLVYVSRGFPKEENYLISHLQTSIERYMAAEYSRQLSSKVLHGCIKVVEQGFSAGGKACYGLKRLLLDVHKNPKHILQAGEHKAISNERVTFVPSEGIESSVVKEIFELFVERWAGTEAIALHLNRQGITSASGLQWRASMVAKILRNPTYIGTLTYNKTTNHLKTGIRNNDRKKWILHVRAFQPLISEEMFWKAQERLRWSSPIFLSRGLVAIAKAKRIILADIRELIGEDGASIFPIIFSMPFILDRTSRWCFVLPMQYRKFSHVLGIGVAIGSKRPVDCFFLLPTDEFDLGNVLILDESDEATKKYVLMDENVEQGITKIASLIQ